MSGRVPKAVLSMADGVVASIGYVSIFRGMRRKGEVLLHVIYSAIVMYRIKREKRRYERKNELEERKVGRIESK
jgi:hypothetical protein